MVVLRLFRRCCLPAALLLAVCLLLAAAGAGIAQAASDDLQPQIPLATPTPTDISGAPTATPTPTSTPPAAGPVTVTVHSQVTDGEVMNTDCSDWTTCRNSSSGTYAWSSMSGGTVQAVYDDGVYQVKRVFFDFDTSAIPPSAHIEGAVLNVYAANYLFGSTMVHVVRSNADIPLSVADFSRLEFVSGGAAAPTTIGWMNISLNPSALNWLVPGGTTKLALVHDFDLNDSTPSTRNSLLIAFAEDSQYRPSLVVTYRAAPESGVVALRAGARPTIDGYLWEWGALPATHLDRANAASITGSETYPSPADLSADLRSAWRPGVLYLAAAVTDDVLVGNQSARPWNDDAIELSIYLPATGQTHQFTIGLDGRQYQNGLPITSLSVAIRTSAGGWTLETVIPAWVLGLDAFAPTRRIPSPSPCGTTTRAVSRPRPT